MNLINASNSTPDRCSSFYYFWLHGTLQQALARKEVLLLNQISFPGVSTPYADTSLRWIAHLPLVFVICVAMTFLTLVLSGEVDHGIFFLLLFWFSASIGVGAMIYRNAADLVDFPKLKKLA